MDRFATTAQIEEFLPPEEFTEFPASMSTEEFLAAFMKKAEEVKTEEAEAACLLYTSPSPRDRQKSRMPSSA